MVYEGAIKTQSPRLAPRGKQKSRLLITANNNIAQNTLFMGGNNSIVSPGREEDETEELTPPLDIMGVETENILEFGIDYLEFTLKGGKNEAMEIYSKLFLDYLGGLQFEGQTRLYEERYTNGAGFTLLCQPRVKIKETHTHWIFPGKMCQAIPFEVWGKMVRAAKGEGIKLSCSRLDIRIDNCPFKPLEVAQAIEEGYATTRAKRSTLKKYDQPFQEDEKGNMGTQGMYIGSRQSEKFIRIYDLHGYTRLEMQTGKESANQYFYQLQQAEDQFNNLAMGFILDYIDIDAGFWRLFKYGYQRAYMKTTVYQDPTLERLEKYLLQQAAIPYYLLMTIKGEKFSKMLYEEGRKRAGEKTKYYPLMHAYGISVDDI